MHDPTRLLAEINRRYGTAYQLLGAYAGGEQGAFALRRGDHRAVLKWSSHTDLSAYEQAAVVTAQLRTRGYPAPHFELVGRAGGGVFAIQAELPGEPARVPDLQVLAQVVPLNALQAGHAIPGPHTWPDRIIHTLRVGGNGYCLHASLQTWSAETRAMLTTLQRIATVRDRWSVPTDDMVHYDFTWANILVQNRVVRGVIDWDATCAGDRAFDLATLLFYSYADAPCRRVLWDALDALREPDVAALYLAHLILRQVDWSIRQHTPTFAEHWIATSAQVLEDLRRRGVQQ
jgi:hypothetical protein